MSQIVGISQKIKRAWLDAVLDRLVTTTEEGELRAFLDQLLKEELPGKESRAKTAGIILRVWSGIPPERVALRDRAVALLPRITGQERIWLHWGMTALAYPFFRDTAEVVGRLLALQDDITSAQVQSRLLTTWGDRATTKDAAKKLVNTLVDWEVLRSTKTRGHFLPARKMTASIPDLQLWLLEALLGASTADEIEAQQLLRLPESFAFTIGVGVSDLRQYDMFDIHRQGLDMDMVALRKVRVPVLPKRKAKPAPEPEGVPKSPGTSPRSRTRQSSGNRALPPGILGASVPEQPLEETRQTQPAPENDHADRLVQATLFERPVEDAATADQVSQVEAAIPAAAMTATSHISDATTPGLGLSQRLIAVRDQVSEALRMVRETGDQGEIERLLVLAHDSLAEFSEPPTLFHSVEIAHKEMPVDASHPVSEMNKPAKAAKTAARKSKPAAVPSFPPASADVPAEIVGLKALSVRQPHAEAMMRGNKTTDVRSTATKFRGRILIYASQGRDDAATEAAAIKEHSLENVALDDLPRGVLIGTVELYGCEGCQWFLRNPQRLETPVKPAKQPKPVWFNPF